jgi:hypothetical protein
MVEAFRVSLIFKISNVTKRCYFFVLYTYVAITKKFYDYVVSKLSPKLQGATMIEAIHSVLSYSLHQYSYLV